MENIVLADPPNKRSVLAALFYKNLVLRQGALPSWCKDVLCNEQLSGEGFELSKMIQWALDNNCTDESSIAYKYSLRAEEDHNAQLFLKSNSQAKYVRDCAAMVRHFNRGRMVTIPMVEHMASRIREYKDEGNEDGWKSIVVLLRYQHVPLKDMLMALSYWLRGRPKKSTMAICGVPDSGKSMFTLSLIRFLDGKVLSFANNKSHFWLQPLTECKYAAIDDVTLPCWDYINIYLRNALDGNTICVDCKHRAPVQLKCPPLLLTTNYDPRVSGYDGEGTGYKYLKSRIQFFCFNRPIPIYGCQPRFLVEASDWRSFFLKFRKELELDIDQYDYGESASEADEPAGQGGRPN